MCCLIADLFPKRRNAQNRFPLYGFGAILGVFFRYERLCFDGGILYRQPFKSRCLSLPGNKKAPYCYDAFVLLGRWSKGTLFNYLLYFSFLLTTVFSISNDSCSSSHNAMLIIIVTFPHFSLYILFYIKNNCKTDYCIRYKRTEIFSDCNA